MKIALTADPFLPVPPEFYGGIERIIALLLNELTNKGHEVTLFAHKDSKVPCELIPYPAAGNGLKDNINNAFLINRVISSHKFDLVHSFGRLAMLTMLLPKIVPKLMSYQRPPTIQQVKRAQMLARKNTLAFTGCSDYITRQITPYAEAYTVYNCVDPLKYNLKTNVADDAPLVFLGRVEPIKGAHTAIRIAKETNRKLVIAGNIPEGQQSYFDEQIRPHLGEQVSYIGAVNDAQKNALLGNAAVFLMPIEWDEPFGIVMIEAMACGTPVVGLSRGSVPEVVDQDITGYHTHDVNKMAGYVKAACKLSRSKVRAMFEQRFTGKVIADEYLKVYSKMLNGI